jgi:hypothetical protein
MQKLGSSEMENVQASAWATEIATGIVAVLIAGWAWKVGRGAVQKKQSSQLLAPGAA